MLLYMIETHLFLSASPLPSQHVKDSLLPNIMNKKENNYMSMRTGTGLEKGIQKYIKIYKCCMLIENFKNKIIKNYQEKHTLHCEWLAHTNCLSVSLIGTLCSLYSIFPPFSSCLVQTPYPLNWILAPFQCLRLLYLK